MNKQTFGSTTLNTDRTNMRLTEVYEAVSRNAGGIIDVADGTTIWWKTAFTNLARFAGDVHIHEITPAILTAWYSNLLITHQINGANSYMQSVKTAYYRLMRRGLASDNPACYIQCLPPDPHVPAAATLETYLAMRQYADLKRRAIVSFVWGTGCRISEVCSIRLNKLEFWQQDDALCMAAEIFGKHPRRRPGRAKRTVYADGLQATDVHDYYIHIVNAPPGREYLFTNEDGMLPIAKSAVRWAWSQVVKDCNFTEDVTCNPHSFRHAFAYRKRAEGYPLEWISQWLGHTDPAFTAKFYGDKSEPESRKRFFRPPPTLRTNQ